MAKSPDAFRTISEVADWLGVQAHVLRFWESKFAQVKPIKRAGGRRYYRPADMLLLGGIKKLLHDDGLTIKGTQKLLREKGVPFVADLSQPLDDLTMAVIEGGDQPDTDADDISDNAEVNTAPVTTETGVGETDQQTPVLEEDIAPAPMDSAPAQVDVPESDLTSSDPATAEPETVEEEKSESPSLSAAPETEAESAPNVETDEAVEANEPAAAPAEDETTVDETIQIEEVVETAPEAPAAPQEEPTVDEAPEPVEETALQAEKPQTAEMAEAEPESPSEKVSESTPAPDDDAAAPVPSFRARARSAETAAKAPEPQDAKDAPELDLEAAEEPKSQDAAKPRLVDVPPVPPLSEIEVSPSVLSALSRLRQLSPEHAREIKPHLARLTRLRASMANPRKDASKD